MVNFELKRLGHGVEAPKISLKRFHLAKSPQLVTGGLAHFSPNESGLRFRGEMQLAFLPPFPADRTCTVIVRNRCDSALIPMSGPGYRKAIALGGIYWASLCNGFLYGQMTGMISALKKQDEGIVLSDTQISWIASSLTTIAILGVWLAAAVADKIGRRWSFILSSILIIINWIILYTARDMLTFMLSRTIGGFALGALLSLTICVTSEYISPKTRGFYLNMITTLAPAIGTGFGHILGIVLHWRNVALIGILLSTIGAIIPYFWLESPHWLALRGKFAECERSFRKLHGKSAEKELRELIKIESAKLDATGSNNSNTYKNLYVAVKRGYFWELMILTAIIYAYLAAAGKLVFSILATVMLEEMTGADNVLLYTLLVDGFIVIGSLLSCILIRTMTMRNLLFSTGFIANVVLITLSACLYFKTEEVYFQWINVTLLAIYFIVINAGPYPVTEALVSELFPLDLKLYCVFFSFITYDIFLTTSVMLFPLMVSSIGYHGMFLTNAAIMSLSLVYVWIKLPETKGRTLQEIEVYFKTKDFDVDKALNDVQMKTLLR